MYLRKKLQLKYTVLSKLHASPISGKLGFTKTYERVKRSFFFILASFFLAFRVLNFRGRFEALNNVFWARHSHTIESQECDEKCVVLG
jgi:hypothetical protein